MTVAEYQQAQKDIAEIRGQIAQLRDVVAKGVPAMRGVYGLDQPEAQPQIAEPQQTPQMMSAHEQVGTPNVNPFQDNFTPSTNVKSMQEIAGRIAPQIDQPLGERIARGAMNLPVGMAAMAEQATSDPAGFAKGTAEYADTWMKRLNPNLMSPEAMVARTEFGQQLATDPVGTGLDALGVAGTALGLPGLGGKIKGFKSIKEARAAIKDIGKPKVDVPEVVQEPIRSETPKVDLSSKKPQPTTAQEVVETAKPLINQDVPTPAPNVSQQKINQMQVRSHGWSFESAYNRLSGDGGSQKVGQVELQMSDNGLEAFHAVTGSKLGDISFDGSVIPTKEKFRSQLENVVDYYEKQSKLMDVASELSRPNVRAEGLTDIALLAESNPEALKYVDKPTRDLIDISEKFKPTAKQPTTATEVVAKAKPNAVTQGVKQLTPDELTAAQARLREKFEPMDEATKPQTPQAISEDLPQQVGKPVDEYVYHRTGNAPEIIESIKKKGLLRKYAGEYPHGVPDIPDEIPRIYFGESPQKTSDFGGKNILRVKRSVIADNMKSRNMGLRGEEVWYFGDKIHPADIEMQINGEWKPLGRRRSGKISTKPPKATPDAGATPAQSTTMAKEPALPSSVEVVTRKVTGGKTNFIASEGSVSEKAINFARKNPLKIDSQIQRLNDYYAGRTLGRNMNESVEAYFDRTGKTAEMKEVLAARDFLKNNKESLFEKWSGEKYESKPTTAEAVVKKAGENVGEPESIIARYVEKGQDSQTGDDIDVVTEWRQRKATEADRKEWRSATGRWGLPYILEYRTVRGIGKASDWDALDFFDSPESGLQIIERSSKGKAADILDDSMWELRSSERTTNIRTEKLKIAKSELASKYEKEYADRLKELGLLNKAKKGKAPQDVIDKIKSEINKAYKSDLDKITADIKSENVSPRRFNYKQDDAPSPTELSAGVNPFKIIDDYMTKRKLVNPLGTPEYVLSGKGIVEPFRKAQESIRNETKARGESLQETLKGIKRGSDEDNALYHRLDDPKAVLNEQEQAVRDYLDNILTEVNKHREARGQEPVKRRKGYITHLVEEVEKQSREYGDTPMPKRFRFQFELAREGNASHKVSAIEALEVYTKAALKDIYIGDALAETVPKIEAMGDRPLIFKKSVTSPDGKVTNMSFYQFSDAPIITERGYAESFIKGQMNVPTVGQRIMEKAFDIKPNTSSHAAMAVTARFYQSLLGLAVDSSVKNLTQGINTMAEMGVLPTLKGYAKLATAKGLKTAKAEHLLEDFNPLLMEGADLPFKTKTARAIGKGFSATMNAPMKVAEFINRGAAYHAAYDVYIKKGMSLEQAHEAARAAVRKTQFSYSKIDTSPALRGPFARTFSQFFSYPLKQSEMMYKWATKPGEQGKLVRYFLYTGMAVVGAKYGGVDLSGVFFDPIRMVDPNSKEGFQLPGTDKRVTFDASKLGKSGYTPQGFAPSISIPADFIKSQMSDDESAREYGRKKALTNIIPGGRYGKKVYDVITESDEKGKRDRLTRENTTKDKVLKLLGGKSTDREAESSRRELASEVEKKYYATRQKLIDLKISGNEDEFIKLRDEFRDRYPFLYGRLMKGFGDAVKEERKKKGMTTDERFFDNSLRKQIDANL